MNKLKKKTFIFIVSICMMIGFAAGVGANSALERITANLDHRISFIVNGGKWTPTNSSGQKLSPIIYNGSTYLPVRAISEALNTPVNWEASSRTITIGERTEALDFGSLNIVGIPYHTDKTTDPTIVNQGGTNYNIGFITRSINSASKSYKVATGNQFATANLKLYKLDNISDNITVNFRDGDTLIRSVEIPTGQESIEVEVNLGGVSELTLQFVGRGGSNARVFVAGSVK